MEYLIEHTVFFDGVFRPLTLILVFTALAIIAYCVIRVIMLKKELNKLKKESESAAAAVAAETAAAADKISAAPVTPTAEPSPEA